MGQYSTIAGLMVLLAWEYAAQRTILAPSRYWHARVAALVALWFLMVKLPLGAARKHFDFPYTLDLISEQPVLVQAAAGLLLVTFLRYWLHRLKHENSFLWRHLHQLHHSATRIECLTSFYKHPLELLLTALVTLFGLFFVLNVTFQAFALVVGTIKFLDMFQHSNVSTPRWMGFLLHRPESHSVHHKADHHRDNYCEIPLWDQVFGTFQNPAAAAERAGFGAEEEDKVFRRTLFY